MLGASVQSIDVLENKVLDRLFRDARSYNGWLPGDVSDESLKRIYGLLKSGPTSMNSQPAQLFFLKSATQKERLRPHLSPGNVDKMMTAPAVTIIGYDLEFHAQLPVTFPHLPTAKAHFDGEPEFIETTALRNSSLQGAYLIVAARALGFDCAPISGFNNAGVDAEFFANTSIRSSHLRHWAR